MNVKRTLRLQTANDVVKMCLTHGILMGGQNDVGSRSEQPAPVFR